MPRGDNCQGRSAKFTPSVTDSQAQWRAERVLDTGRTRRPPRRAKMLLSCHRRPGAWSFPPCAYAWPAVASNCVGGPGVAAPTTLRMAGPEALAWRTNLFVCPDWRSPGRGHQVRHDAERVEQSGKLAVQFDAVFGNGRIGEAGQTVLG